MLRVSLIVSECPSNYIIKVLWYIYLLICIWKWVAVYIYSFWNDPLSWGFIPTWIRPYSRIYGYGIYLYYFISIGGFILPLFRFWYFCKIFIFWQGPILLRSTSPLFHFDHILKCSHRFLQVTFQSMKFYIFIDIAFQDFISVLSDVI